MYSVSRDTAELQGHETEHGTLMLSHGIEGIPLIELPLVGWEKSDYHAVAFFQSQMHCQRHQFLVLVHGSPARKKSAMEDLFGEVFVVKEEMGENMYERVQHEIEQYTALPAIHINESPLDWWKVEAT